jgi:hypothetical protein
LAGCVALAMDMRVNRASPRVVVRICLSPLLQGHGSGIERP